MGTPNYTAPKIEKVGAEEEPSVDTSQTADAGTTVVETVSNKSERNDGTTDVIGPEGQIYSPIVWSNMAEPGCYEDEVYYNQVEDPATKAVHDILLTRVRKHLRHIGGELSYRNDKEKAAETFSFINSFMLAYEDRLRAVLSRHERSTIAGSDPHSPRRGRRILGNRSSVRLG
jgi:hypothetical protein